MPLQAVDRVSRAAIRSPDGIVTSTAAVTTVRPACCPRACTVATKGDATSDTTTCHRTVSGPAASVCPGEGNVRTSSARPGPDTPTRMVSSCSDRSTSTARSRSDCRAPPPQPATTAATASDARSGLAPYIGKTRVARTLAPFMLPTVGHLVVFRRDAPGGVTSVSSPGTARHARVTLGGRLIAGQHQGRRSRGGGGDADKTPEPPASV